LQKTEHSIPADSINRPSVTGTANSLTPGEIWQEKEVETSDHQYGEHYACGQEDPKLEMIVEVGPVMNALNQIGA
jgi:hypothetical protein